MNEYQYRLIGRLLAFIGMLILLFPIFIISVWFLWYDSVYIPQLLEILILAGLVLLGLIVASSGVIIHRRFREIGPFLTKDGEPIHSGNVWKKGTEPGLFLTSCERVVSIYQDSRETAHVGYRTVIAKRATCSDCNLRKGRAILDSVPYGRGGA